MPKKKIISSIGFLWPTFFQGLSLYFWTLRRRRSYKMASVCMSVCMYVCHSRPALTTPTIFLIFGMKVGDH